jgi:hypothetical protein
VKEYHKKWKDYDIEMFELIIHQNFINQLHFEIKIGLLKFICDDITEDKFPVIISYYHLNNEKKWGKDITDICPKEFLESIFK